MTHRLVVRRELIEADEILRKYMGPTHPIRADLRRMIEGL